jgi:ATP-dependent DNA helicase RecQ
VSAVQSYRPNLRYEVVPIANEPQRRGHLVRLLRDIDGPGIVYASDVRQVDLLYDLLGGLGFEVVKDHSRMAPKRRTENRDRFMAGGLDAMIATSAFDADPDKPDVRFVIHYNMPASLEAYAMESGRAGRDGRPSLCLLLYHVDDLPTPIYFMSGRYPRAEDLQTVYAALEELGAPVRPVPLADLRARTSPVALTKLRVVIALLKDLGVLQEQRGALVRLVKSGLSPVALAEMSDEYRASQSASRKGLDRMIAYAESHECRWNVLLDRAGDPVEAERCGICDNCRRPLEKVSPTAERTKAADNS